MRLCNRWYVLLLVMVTLLAWGLRVGVTAKFIGLSTPVDLADGLDETDYEQFTYEMSVGHGYVLEDGTPTARRAPGTSLFILPVYLLFGRSLLAARLWMTFMSAINCAAAAWVVRPRWGNGAALLTAVAIALNPGLFYYSMHLWSEVPYCLAITCAVGCVLRGLSLPNWKWTVAGGVCWGAAVLIRPQVVLVGPWILLALALFPALVRSLWLRELIPQGVVAALVIVPWLIRNQLVMGTITIATLVGGHTFWGSHNDLTFHDPKYQGLWKVHPEDPDALPLTGNEVQLDKQAWNNGWLSIRHNLSELPQLLMWKLYRLVTPFEETPNRAVYWSFAITWIITFPLAARGLMMMRRFDPQLGVWIGFQLAALLISTLLFYGAARFRHSVEPFLMMAAAIGFTHSVLFQRLRKLQPAHNALNCDAMAQEWRTPIS